MKPPGPTREEDVGILLLLALIPALLLVLVGPKVRPVRAAQYRHASRHPHRVGTVSASPGLDRAPA